MSICYRYTQTQQVLSFYGGATAESLTSRKAETTLYLLGKPVDESPQVTTLHAGSQMIDVVVESEQQVTKTAGFHNARNAMTLDRSYDWADTRQPAELTWRYALKIVDEDRTSTLIFSTDCQYIMLATLGQDQAQDVPAVPAAEHAVRASAMGAGIERLFSEQFEGQ